FAIAAVPGTGVGAQNAQLFDITLPNADTTFTFAAYPGAQVPASPNPQVPFSRQRMQMPGFFSGCVLTPLDGGLANRSTRIVGWGWDMASSQYFMRVVGYSDLSLANNAPARMLINGRPF